MDVSGIGSTAAEASYVSGASAMSELSMAIFKQQQDQQQRMGDALVQMIKNTPTASLTGTGKIIDVFA